MGKTVAHGYLTAAPTPSPTSLAGLLAGNLIIICTLSFIIIIVAVGVAKWLPSRSRTQVAAAAAASAALTAAVTSVIAAVAAVTTVAAAAASPALTDAATYCGCYL